MTSTNQQKDALNEKSVLRFIPNTDLYKNCVCLIQKLLKYENLKTLAEKFNKNSRYNENVLKTQLHNFTNKVLNCTKEENILTTRSTVISTSALEKVMKRMNSLQKFTSVPS